MDIVNHQTDFALAQETCVKLRSGNNDAILPVYQKYHPLFMGYMVEFFRTRTKLDSFIDALTQARDNAFPTEAAP